MKDRQLLNSEGGILGNLLDGSIDEKKVDLDLDGN